MALNYSIAQQQGHPVLILADVIRLLNKQTRGVPRSKDVTGGTLAEAIDDPNQVVWILTKIQGVKGFRYIDVGWGGRMFRVGFDAPTGNTLPVEQLVPAEIRVRPIPWQPPAVSRQRDMVVDAVTRQLGDEEPIYNVTGLEDEPIYNVTGLENPYGQMRSIKKR